jgi:cell wall-associated NlpC family hydrolase
MPSPVSRWCLRSGIAVAPAAIAVSLVSVPAHADTKADVAKLQNQLEQLTEQFDGFNVQLKNSQAAAKVAQDQADAATTSLGAVRTKLKQMAATTYMHDGGDDSWAPLVSSSDPTTLLGSSAALQYVTSQKNVQVTTLLTAAQQAARANSTAKEKTTEVQALQKQIGDKKSSIEKLLAKNKAKLSAISSGSGGSSPTTSATASGSGVKITGSTSAKALAATKAALSKIGSTYVYGAAGPTTFDCSGLTRWAYSKVGISLDHFTGSQYNEGTHVSQSAMRPGDLVFFYSDHHHVGLYIGGDRMVDAPHTGTVVQVQSLAGRTITGVVRVA